MDSPIYQFTALNQEQILLVHEVGTGKGPNSLGIIVGDTRVRKGVILERADIRALHEALGAWLDRLTVGARVFIEQAWEDQAGNLHDAYAEVIGIAEDGELRLRFEDKAIDDFYGNGAAGAGFGTETPVEVVA